MADKLTPQQEMAVTSRGGKLLVSAAAGSGKTKVLVDRLLGFLTQTHDPANLDEFLIITYTKAAASELRGKIAKKLTEEIAQRPEETHLQRQMQRLFLTKISTVHGFCSDLLREYAYKLDIAADFRVADENECREIRETVLEGLLDRAYETAGDDPDFRAFVDTQGVGRSDRQVPEIIEKVYDSAHCHLNPEAWLDKCLTDADAEGIGDVGETVWGQYLIRNLQEYLDCQIAVLRQCAESADNCPGLGKPAVTLRDAMYQLEQLRACTIWDDIVAKRELRFGSLRFPTKDNPDPELTDRNGADTRIVYTPLHGSGNVPVREILRRIGIKNISVVKEQEEPDGSFPTVKAPNPEDPNAFTLAFDLANKTGANLILATDPDSDRLGAAVRRRDGRFQVLTGNQIGSILIHYILSTRNEQGTLPGNGLVVRSIVSTRMADAICAYYGVELREVLTGFRFISEQIAESLETKEHTFLFGFEESYGFLSGCFSRDKDAICAAMLLAEAATVYDFQESLYDVLQEIYEKYGFYGEAVKSYTLKGKEGLEKIAGAIRALRADKIAQFGGVRVVKSEDIQTGTITYPDGREEKCPLPKSNVLRYFTEGDGWLCVRPSGTEPKLKLYIGAKGSSEAELKAELSRLMTAADGMISELLK